MVAKLVYGLFGFIGVGGGFVLHLIKGGYTIDRKIENGQFLFLYRNEPGEWVPVSKFLYFSDVAHGALFISLLFLFFLFVLIGFKIDRKDP